MANWQYGLLFDDAKEFLKWLSTIKYSAKITGTHLHHTWKPSHKSFTGSNYKRLQDAMRRAHKIGRKFQDIAQHLSIFPDGKVMTGRNIDIPPASATNYNDPDSDNEHPFMVEMIGNFDIGNDKLEGRQLQSVIEICRHFGNVMFHREGLINGKQPKSCPGTSIDKKWFMGLVNGSEDYMMKPEDVNELIERFLSPMWFFCQSKEDKDKCQYLANELRKASGQKKQ
jgi:hypothetical protein